MIAVASSKIIIIEFPDEMSTVYKTELPVISTQMKSLLADYKILKVYCDFFERQIPSLRDLGNYHVDPCRCVEQMSRWVTLVMLILVFC
jgi:hypothetical protein